MSRTAKWEHPSDSFHTNRRDERRARPAGRIVAMVEAELAAEGSDEEDILDLDQIPTVEDQMDLWDEDRPRHDTPCGGWCRRCLIHNDPGGCLALG